MKKLIAGVIVGFCLPLLGAYLFLIGGGMPVATKGPPLPLERFIAKAALHKAMDNEINKPSPVPADETNLQAGAKVYVVHCSVCHGGPGDEPSFIAKGLFPKPPQLFGQHGVTDDPVGESYWKIKNGIRLTGMPGFDGNLTDTELWQVSQLVYSADKISDDIKQILKQSVK